MDSVTHIDSSMKTVPAVFASAQKITQQSGGESFADTLASVSAMKDDAVSFSAGRGLLSKAELLLPTMENVRNLLAGANEALGKLFREAGIETEPPVELRINSYTGKTEVVGDRADADRIEALLAENPEVGMQVHNALALSSHAYALPEHLRFQAEYRASRNPEAVVAKYAHLFGRQEHHDYVFRLSGGASDIVIDGEAWAGTES